MEKRFIKREEVAGKLVVDQEARVLGKVTDLAVTYDGKAVITVGRETEEGVKEEVIPMDRVAAIGDVILLKGEATPTVQPTPAPTPTRIRICPNCGAENKPTAKFCIKCGTKLVP